MSSDNGLQEITNSEDLVVGELYWLKSKSTGNITVDKCNVGHCGKYFHNHIWTENDNPQGFQRWRIFKVEVPKELLEI